MTEQNEPHICRSCGHVGAPDWKSWDMVEHKQDGSTSEWSGSSPICAECGAYVCTKQEWLESDWGETDEHDKYFGRGLYSIMAIVLAFIASDFSFLPSWFGMAIIAIGILSLIHSMSSYSQTKKRYMQMREEEENGEVGSDSTLTQPVSNAQSDEEGRIRERVGEGSMTYRDAVQSEYGTWGGELSEDR